MLTWDDAAGWYISRLRAGGGFNDLAADVALELLADVAGRHVLDVGCGEGHVARRLARAGARVTAVEPTGALLAAARDAERRDRLGITYEHAPAEDLGDIPAATVDEAVAVLVLHHVEHPAAALAELRRVLRPGGALAVVLPHPWVEHPGARWEGAPEHPRRQLGDYRTEGYWSTGRALAELGAVRDIGWHHRTLGTWLTMFAAAGFRLDEAREPAAGPGPWAATPRFFAARLRREP